MNGEGIHTMALSDSGRRRRTVIGEHFAAAVVQRAARQRTRRRALAAAAALVAVAGAWWTWSTRPGAVGGPPPGRDALAVVVVHDDPAVLQRLSVTAAVDPSIYVDDRGLQELLQQNGRGDGVVRAGERLVLPGLVVDDWRAAEAP